MKRALCAALLVVSLAAAAEQPLADLTVTGSIRGHTVRQLGGGETEVVVLIEGEDAVRLLAVRPGDTAARPLARLPLADDPPQLTALDLDGDGREEVLVSTADGSFAVDSGGLRALSTTPYPLNEALALGSPGRRDRLAIIAVGGLSVLGGAGGALAQLERLPLRVEVERRSTSLLLATPRLQRLDRPAGSPLLWGAPQDVGGGRLRVDLYDLAAVGEERHSERWLRLPGPEAVESSAFAWLEGQPVLLVTTLPTDRIGVFAEQTLHLYRPSADRRRLGSLPFLTVPTEAKRWQRADPQLVDVSGDGREDLVILHPKGLGGETLLVDTYLRQAGRFALRPKRLKIDVETEIWRYGDDVTGDGRPDLLAESDGELLLFPGIEPEKGRPLSRQAAARVALELATEEEPHSISVGTGGDPPEPAEPDTAEPSQEWWVVELDGAPPRELLLLSSSGGSSRIRVVRLAD